MLITAIQVFIFVVGSTRPAPLVHHQDEPPTQSQNTLESTTPNITNADELLAALDEADSKLKNFSARILYRKVQGLLGDKQTRYGQLYFQQDAETKIKQFCVKFNRLELGNAVEEESRDFIFDGRWLVERINDEKHFIRREVVRPGETFDALSLDGPFPLPIGQSKETVLKRFEATLLTPETEGRLQNCYKLFLKPKAKVQIDTETGRLTDETIDDLTLWYDKVSLLPIEVLINETSGDTKTMKLVDLVINADLDPQLFNTTPPGPNDGWRVTIEAFDRR